MQSNDHNTERTARLSQLISAKLKILRQVRELTRLQPEIIAKGDMGRLLHVLAAKERLLGEMRNLEDQLNPFREEDPDARIWESVDARLRCRAEAEECERLLKEIVTTEQSCESDLIARRELTAQRLHTAHNASHAATAYGARPQSPRSLDISSE